MGADAHLPHDPDPVLHLAPDGLLQDHPLELEECARIDGATRFGAMVRIIFPVAIPGILSAGIFAFTLSWNEFIYALVFMASADQKTVPVGVVSELIRGDIFFWGQLMAGALLGSVPVALVYSLRRVLRHRPHRLGERVRWPTSASAS